MPQAASRPFKVRARHEDAHHGRLVIEPSFEAAAVAYVEHLPISAGHPEAISVVVHDVESGHEHAFLVHLGESPPPDPEQSGPATV